MESLLLFSFGYYFVLYYCVLPDSNIAQIYIVPDQHLVPFRGIDVGGESEPFRVSSTLPPNSITRDIITYFVDEQGHRALTKGR